MGGGWKRGGRVVWEEGSDYVFGEDMLCLGKNTLCLGWE